MVESWSVGRILDWMRKDLTERGVDSPRLDAELILSDAIGVPRMQLYMDLDRPLSEAELTATRARFVRRRAREPMAYILGYRDFYKHRFAVSSAVLVPRPDSELLVDKALAWLADRPTARVADVCTGSGCVGLSIGKARQEAGLQTELVLTDISPDALAVVKQNQAALEVKAKVREGDLFAPLSDAAFDLITINPPYIAESVMETLMPEVTDHEPHLALVGGADGRVVLRRIPREAQALLAADGVLMVEVGHDQAAHFGAALRKVGYAEVLVHKDLGGIERMVEARRVATLGEMESERVEVDASEHSAGLLEEEDFQGERRVELDEPDWSDDRVESEASSQEENTISLE